MTAPTITIGRFAGNTVDVTIGTPVTAHVTCGCWLRAYPSWYGRITGTDSGWVMVRRIDDGKVYRASAACLARVEEHHILRAEAELNEDVLDEVAVTGRVPEGVVL